jgi:hypothetical protein
MSVGTSVIDSSSNHKKREGRATSEKRHSYMVEQTRNEEARAELDSEMAKFGLKPEPVETNPKKPDEQGKEEPTKEPEPKKEEQPVKKEDPKPEDKKPEERPKKYIPIPEHQALKDKYKALEDELADIKAGNGADKEKKVEIDNSVKEFAQSLGVEDPEVLEKILTFVTQGTQKTVAELEKKIVELQGKKAEEDHQAQIKKEAERFDSEWNTFSTTELKKAYPDATPEQLAEARTMMDELSHSKDWHKYDLDYIFFKNKKDFDDSIGVKKFKGSGSTKQQDMQQQDKKPEVPTLSENPTPDEVKAYERHMAGILSGGVLAEKPNERL